MKMEQIHRRNTILKFLFISAVALTNTVACTNSSNSLVRKFQTSVSTGIVGGSNAMMTDPISMTVVALFDSQEHFLCTGSILSYELILTAGNCANRANPRAMIVLFGLTPFNKTGSPTVSRQVVDLRLNPHYEEVVDSFDQDSTLDPESVKDWGDIAILKFVGGLPPGYHPAQLLPGNQGLRNGVSVTIAGYGEIDGNRHLGAGQLKRADMILADMNYSPTEMVIDQRQGMGACHGDSGGPIYLNLNGVLYLFGINSRGVKDPRNNCSGFSIYSSVAGQMPFISKSATDLTAAAIPTGPPQTTAPTKSDTPKQPDLK